MFSPIQGGTVEVIQGLECHMPPVGYVYNNHTGSYQKTTVLYRKKKPSDQFWQREGLPPWYADKRISEQQRQVLDPDYVDGDCEEFRKDQWEKRLYGAWIMVKGTPVYLTGMYWFYLSWWWLGKSYPDFRNYQKETFYLLEWAKECPFCYGGVLMIERQGGKTGIAGLFMYDHCSRIHNAHGNCQSKSEDDARDVIYRKSIMVPFLKLPHYFQPKYDTSNRLTTGISFSSTIIMGKDHSASFKTEILGSSIKYEDSTETAMEGKTLDRYVGDEIFKTLKVDIRKRHEIILPTLAPNGPIDGKCLYTSTVEEIEGHPEISGKSVQFWNDSDQTSADIKASQMTSTGLIRIFFDCRQIRGCDKYGDADFEGNNIYYQSERAKRSHDTVLVNDYIRKHPFSPEEAFSMSNTICAFNPQTLNDALAQIRFHHYDFVRTGNFVWDRRDEKVMWVDNPNGRIQTSYLLEDNIGLVNISAINGVLSPYNGSLFAFGIDPFDHMTDSRYHQYSNGAGVIKMKFSLVNEKKYYNDAFILQYCARPPSPQEFYEDMIMISFYYSVPALYEDQKPGIRTYFVDRGYGAFLQYLPGTPDKPGVSASAGVKSNFVNLYHKHLQQSPGKLFFEKMTMQLMSFDIANSTKSDIVMAGGYALICEDAYLSRQIQANQRPPSVRRGIENSMLLRKYRVRAW